MGVVWLAVVVNFPSTPPTPPSLSRGVSNPPFFQVGVSRSPPFFQVVH